MPGSTSPSGVWGSRRRRCRRGCRGYVYYRTSTRTTNKKIFYYELRARLPDLRAHETCLRHQIDALDAQTADRDAYLKLTDDLEGFLAQQRRRTADAGIEERQRVLRLLVNDIIVGPEKITIRHRIPDSGSTNREPHDSPSAEGEQPAGYPLLWGRGIADLVEHLPGPVGPVRRADSAA
jgi:hypothetical protein